MKRRTKTTAAPRAATAATAIATAIVAGIALTACNQPAGNAPAAGGPAGTTAQPAPASAPRPPAVVDGTPITHEALDFVARNNAGKKFDELTAEQQKKLIDELLRIQLLANEAIAKGKDKDRDIVQSIELGRLNVLMQSTLTDYLKDKQPTEAEVRAYYEQWIKDLPRMQYHIHMISVQTQGYAEVMIAELRKGADFVTVAKREASGEAAKQSAANGGWVTLETLAPALSNAISALKVGQYTNDPVQLPEGWGIIKLDETRAAEKPDFDRVRQSLARDLASKKVDALVDELKKKAKIEYATAPPATGG
ncbi:MAG TPA: peptidylprolyl isomerase [Steroidobacteraceae bacterium]|nr:peptidylprolyl isomerase [Steroidobacteraceae bacterium]